MSSSRTQSNYRKFIRTTIVGHNLTLQKLLKKADSAQERLKLTQTPSVVVETLYHEYKRADVINTYLLWLNQCEVTYQEQKKKAVLAISEAFKLFNEEYPEASQEEKDQFINDTMMQIVDEYHKPNTYSLVNKSSL